MHLVYPLNNLHNHCFQFLLGVTVVTKKKITMLSNGPDKKERTKRTEQVGMQKGAIFTIVSAILLIGLNIKFYEIFAKENVYLSLVF